MSKISVIIPNYNCSKWLPLTLDSCLKQGEHLKEIIVVDDFSTDDSWVVLLNYQNLHSNIKIYKNEIKGGNNARNFGFSKSTGDYIQWLDADDQLCEGKFASQLKAFEQQPQADIVYSDWQLDTYDANGILIRRELNKNNPSFDFLLKLLLNEWSAPHVYLLKHKLAELLNSQMAWNPETPVGQDREYFTIAAIVGAKFVYVPGNFAIYNRWNKSSVSAAGQMTRYQSLEKMLTRFEMLLTKQDWISEERMLANRQVIFTEKLTMKALGHPIIFQSDSILAFRNIKWQMISGVRTTIKVWLAFIRLKMDI